MGNDRTAYGGIMKQNLAVIVPSRGRPQNIERWISHLHNADLFVGVDGDDPELEKYTEVVKGHDNVKLIVSPSRKKFAPTLNDISVSLSEEYAYHYFAGDDHKPVTDNWDDLYIEKLKEIKVGVVYGNDLIMGREIATQCAWSSNIVRTLGYAVPDGFVHLYVDNYFMKLAESIDKLVYMPEVVVQHLHPCAGQAQEDLTYREANSPENWTNDRIRFEKYIAEELPRDAAKLKELL